MKAKQSKEKCVKSDIDYAMDKYRFIFIEKIYSHRQTNGQNMCISSEFGMIYSIFDLIFSS